MPELLLFQLYGPLASWGEPAVGEYRPTATHPGKSQIAGLLAAALGIRRDEDERLAPLAHGYGLAVRIDAEGELLRDYHTTQVPPSRKGRRFCTRREEMTADDLYTILSQRDYRVEAAWTCALWARDGAPYTLQELEHALRRPRFVLYLGRKSCPPALPLNPVLLEASTLAEAFSKYSEDHFDKRLSEHLLEPVETDRAGRTIRKRYCWEEPLACGLTPGFSDTERLWHVPRYDLPRSRARWQFASRDEHHAMA